MEQGNNKLTMISGLKKVIATILVVAVLFFSTLAVLSIWDVINVEQVFRKSLLTLVVIFCAAVIILFILSNFFKPDHHRRNEPPL